MTDQGESTTNLIVNYLPQTLPDDEFRRVFSEIGPIKACKICRDRSTGYSYGFGFVEYHSPADSERAIQALNGMRMQNKVIKVAFSRPGGEKVKGANLYVRNVPSHYSDKDLEHLFMSYGDIIQCRTIKDTHTGMTKGVGFVLFDQRAQAEDAMAALDGKPAPGSSSPLDIKFADGNAKKVRAPGASLAGAHHQGAPRFPSPGPMRSQGNRFRYNPMSNSSHYPNIYEEYSRPHMYEEIQAEFQQPRPRMQQRHQRPQMYEDFEKKSSENSTVFVYNIGQSNENDMLQLFAPYGAVQRVDIMRDEEQKGKGFAFVTLMNYKDAVQAIGGLNGYYLLDKPLQVSFKHKK